MRHKIQARAVVYDATKKAILLVRKSGASFWHAPGGGLEDGEDTMQCAAREVLEETGLDVNIKQLIYVQELHDKDSDIIELFWLAELTDKQELDKNHVDVDIADDSIEESGWFNMSEIKQVTVYPEVLKNDFWRDSSPSAKQDVFIGVFK